MNFKDNFIKIGTVNISPLCEKIMSIPDELWEKNSWRQEKFKAHQMTRTIPLIFDEDFRHENPTIHPEYRNFESELKPVQSAITRHFSKSLKIKRLYKKFGPGYFVRINLVDLLPGGQIPPHLDRNFSLTHAHRIHVPVATNDNVCFSVGGEEKNMREGEIWEINNRRVHAVSNSGEQGRVHVILDWVVPGEACCCSRKTHPETPCSPTACEQTDNATKPCSCYP